MSKIICGFDMFEDRKTLADELDVHFGRDAMLSPGETQQLVDFITNFIESRDLKAKFTVFDQTLKMQALPPFEDDLYADFEQARRDADKYHKRQAATSTKTQQTEVRAVVVVHKRKE